MEKNILPPDFDGVFRFTNSTDEDFIGKWNNIEYTFPAGRMTPMSISAATPEEVQSIRKKFAKELAIREFYKTKKFKGLNTVPPGGAPALYTDSDLSDEIQKCLVPLQPGTIKAKKLPSDSAENYRATKVLKEGQSLVADAKGGETL